MGWWVGECKIKMRSIGQQAARNNLKNGNPNETQDKLCCQRGYKINEGQALSLARGVSRGRVVGGAAEGLCAG